MLRLLLLFLLSITAPAWAQRQPHPLPPVPDSLQGLMRRATTPARRAAMLLRVAGAFEYRPDTAGALGYARLAERVARRHGQLQLVGEALLMQATISEMVGPMETAVAQAQAALPLLVGSASWATAHHRLGSLYARQGKAQAGLAALRAAYNAYGRYRNVFEQVQVDNVRGLLFYNQATLDSAEYYWMRAARGLHQLPGKQANEATALANLAALNRRRKQYSSARRYIRQALALHVAAHNAPEVASSYNMLAALASDSDSLQQALHYARQALRLSQRLGRLETQQVALAQLGYAWRQLSRPDSAETYYMQGLATSGGAPTNRSTALLSLAQLYEAAHRPADALHRALELEALDSTSRSGSTTAANLGLLARLAHARHDDAAAFAYLQRQRTLEQRLATAASSKEIATLRVRFDTERTEQALALASARAATEAQRATALRLLSQQHDAAYRDTLSRRQQQLLTGQLVAARQAGSAAEARQQLLALRHQSQVQAQATRLQAQAARLQAQQQELAVLRARQQLLGLAGLTVLTLVGGGLLFWRYRQRQAAARAAAETALRQRLAADLHDDVGSLLTQISLRADLLRQPTATPAATLAHLDRLADTSRRAARQMADVVWSLQPTATTLPAVLLHMRDHAHEVLLPAGLAVDFGVSPGVDTLAPSAAVCQHLYLIYKECLHNVVRHGHGATRVTVRLTWEADNLCLSVRDDAPGPAVVGRPGGHGLPNMRRRAEAVGGRVQVEADATGFAVLACLPG